MYAFALLIGIIAGLRTMTAPTAISWAAWSGRLALEGSWLAFLGYSWTPWIFTLLAIGELVGDQLTLSPEENEHEATPPPDTRLIGTLSAGRVTGEARHEGQTVMFVAAPATGVGGYWEGVRPPGGLVLAASSTGAHFLGQVAPAATETAEGPRERIDGIVTLPDGTQLPLTLNAAEPEAAIFRTVVLNDGRHCVLR